MAEDGEISWNKVVMLIFIIASMIILLVLVAMVFVMPALRQ